MPEGDIVARAARRLDEVLAGRVLTCAELRWPTLGAADLVGVTVLENVSRGKHLLTRFDDGRTLRTHLRMDGSWRIHDVRVLAAGRHPERNSDVRCVLRTDTHLVLGRLLGMMDLVATRDEHTLVGHLGPDLLDPDLDVAAAAQRIRAQGARPIGAVLLDQRVVAGIGTIYLAETLWRCRIHPEQPAGSLGALADDVVATAAALLGRSAASATPTATGYTASGFAGFADTTVGAREIAGFGPAGEGQGRGTYIHGREGKACPRCGAPIARLEVGPPTQRRPAYFCSRCQPAP